MGVFKKTLKIVALIFTICASSLVILCLWWYAPVSVKATNIVKVIDSDIAGDQVRFCNSFDMTPDQFRAYWKDARPIFDFEFHDYSFGSCHYKTTEENREYSIGIGGVGIVTRGDTSYYYVRKNDRPDFADMK